MRANIASNSETSLKVMVPLASMPSRTSTLVRPPLERSLRYFCSRPKHALVLASTRSIVRVYARFWPLFQFQPDLLLRYAPEVYRIVRTKPRCKCSLVLPELDGAGLEYLKPAYLMGVALDSILSLFYHLGNSFEDSIDGSMLFLPEGGSSSRWLVGRLGVVRVTMVYDASWQHTFQHRYYPGECPGPRLPSPL